MLTSLKLSPETTVFVKQLGTGDTQRRELARRCSSTGYVCPLRGGRRKSTRAQRASQRLAKPAAQRPSPEFVLCVLLARRVRKKQATDLFLLVPFSRVQANKTPMHPVVTTIKIATGIKATCEQFLLFPGIISKLFLFFFIAFRTAQINTLLKPDPSLPESTNHRQLWPCQAPTASSSEGGQSRRRRTLQRPRMGARALMGSGTHENAQTQHPCWRGCAGVQQAGAGADRSSQLHLVAPLVFLGKDLLNSGIRGNNLVSFRNCLV